MKFSRSKGDGLRKLCVAEFGFAGKDKLFKSNSSDLSTSTREIGYGRLFEFEARLSPLVPDGTSLCRTLDIFGIGHFLP